MEAALAGLEEEEQEEEEQGDYDPDLEDIYGGKNKGKVAKAKAKDSGKDKNKGTVGEAKRMARGRATMLLAAIANIGGGGGSSGGGSSSGGTDKGAGKGKNKGGMIVPQEKKRPRR
jgi:hypothetical protein